MTVLYARSLHSMVLHKPCSKEIGFNKEILFMRVNATAFEIPDSWRQATFSITVSNQQ